MTRTFKLTDKHLKLLQRAYVRFSDYETGAPEIDGKRPYGNSDIAADVIDILFGTDLPDDARESLYDYAMLLHRETEVALQIVLYTQSFVPGVYRQTSEYGPGWELVL